MTAYKDRLDAGHYDPPQQQQSAADTTVVQDQGAPSPAPAVTPPTVAPLPKRKRTPARPGNV